MKITRQTETSYHVIASDGNADSDMKVVGHELRSNEKRGDVRLRTIRVKLGAKSYKAVTEMPVGTSLVF
jgi:hypothetical protein